MTTTKSVFLLNEYRELRKIIEGFECYVNNYMIYVHIET